MGVLTYLAVTVLGIIGFAVTGPVAGSLAAGIQSAYYGGAVASGSWFAIAQSIAMTSPTPWFLHNLSEKHSLPKELNYQQYLEEQYRQNYGKVKKRKNS